MHSCFSTPRLPPIESYSSTEEGGALFTGDLAKEDGSAKMSGSFMLFKAENLEKAREWLEADIYAKRESPRTPPSLVCSSGSGSLALSRARTPASCRGTFFLALHSVLTQHPMDPMHFPSIQAELGICQKPKSTASKSPSTPHDYVID